MLFDVFAHKGPQAVDEAGEGAVLVECSSDAAESLAVALERRKGAADCVIKRVPPRRLAVAAAFTADALEYSRGGEQEQWEGSSEGEELGGAAAFLCADPRAPLVARRGVVPTSAVSWAESFLDAEGYRAWRYALGLPCGPQELTPGTLSALEANLDALHGLRPGGGFVGADYLALRKRLRGGREVRRVMPVTLGGEGAAKAQAGDEIVLARTGSGSLKDGVGRLLAAEEGRGLALLRVEPSLAAAVEPNAPPLLSAIGREERWAKADPAHAFTVKPHVPSWWPRDWLAAAV